MKNLLSIAFAALALINTPALAAEPTEAQRQKAIDLMSFAIAVEDVAPQTCPNVRANQDGHYRFLDTIIPHDRMIIDDSDNKEIDETIARYKVRYKADIAKKGAELWCAETLKKYGPNSKEQLLQLAGAASPDASSSPTKASRPADVLSEVKKLTEYCKSVKELPGFEQLVDLNQDGVKDYILNFEHAECDGSSLTFCGSAGCQLQIFLSNKGRYVEVYGMAVREFKVQNKGGRALIRAIEHGSYCGRGGADECKSLYAFSGAKMNKVH